MIGVFLDRDGTIGGNGGWCHPNDFQLYEYTPKAIKRLNQAGMNVMLITNQTGIAYKKATEEEFLLGYQRICHELQQQDAFIDQLLYCPHSEEDHCSCRKPQPTLIYEANQGLSLDLSQSFVVGDRIDDIRLAKAISATSILVKTGRGNMTLAQNEEQADYITDTLKEAVEFIMHQHRTD